MVPTSAPENRDHQARQREQRLFAGGLWQEKETDFHNAYQDARRHYQPPPSVSSDFEGRRHSQDAVLRSALNACLVANSGRKCTQRNRRAPRPRLHQIDDGPVSASFRRIGQGIGGAHAADLWKSLREACDGEMKTRWSSSRTGASKRDQTMSAPGFVGSTIEKPQSSAARQSR
jgi:hypothetical protein